MNVTDRRCRPLRLETTSSGCFVPTSHKLNQDGYFRYHIPNPEGGRGTPKFFHRIVWEDIHGHVIPEGWEIDHLCNNRACANIEHLQVLDRTTHLIKTNINRYAERKQQAYEYWLEHKCTGTALGEHFGVTYSAACRWIRDWKLKIN